MHIVQVIYTTHSNEALKPLSDKAIWVCTNDEIFQDKLNIESLRALTAEVSAKMVVYVEDVFAQRWIDTLIMAMPVSFRSVVE